MKVMEKNYTPLDIGKVNKSNDQMMTFLLLLAIITLFILAVVLFLFIQKVINQNSLPVAPTPTEIRPSPLPTFEPTPTNEVSPSIESSTSPSANIAEPSSSPVTKEVVPSEEATQSAQ
jgi:hypothetical protein